MNNDECNVVRDLMPLCIDGVASEESQGMVQAHLAECEACARIYADMQDALVRQVNEEDEKREIEAIAKQVRKRKICKTAILCLSMLVCAVLIFLAAYHADSILFRVTNVHLNGDLREDALFVKVSRLENNEVLRYVHLASAPSGSPAFEFEFEPLVLDDGASLCIQVRAKYKGWDLDDYEESIVFSYGHEQDGVWVGYADEEYGYLPIVRIELLSGNDVIVLWEVGDEVPLQHEVNNEIQDILDSQKPDPQE